MYKKKPPRNDEKNNQIYVCKNSFLPDNIKILIKNIINKEKPKNYTVEEKPTKSIENYLSEITEVNIKGTFEGGDKEMNIFVKQIPRETHLTFVPLVEIYSTEAFVYNELVPLYEALQEKFNIPHEERFKTAKSYGENTAEAIILENLSKKGYMTWNGMEVISKPFAELSVNQLAKFHALSIVLQKQRQEYFNEKLRNYRHVSNNNKKFHIFRKESCINSSRHLSDFYKEKLQKIIGISEMKFEKQFDISVGFCCICHGDYRSTNILYKETDGEIQEVIPIDYQSVYYGNPLHDFMYLMFSSTDSDFRREHMEILKNLYYNTLKDFLKYFDLHLNKLFPRKVFEEQFEDSLEFGLLWAMICLPVIFKRPHSDLDVDARCYERIEGILDDFIQIGYFQL